MIKKYNQYIKESLLDNIRGLNEDEILDSLKKLDPWKMYLKSIEMNFEFGIKYAVDNYGYKKEYKKYLQIEKDFKSILDNCEIRKFQDLNIKNTNVYYILNNKIFMSLEGNCIIDYNYIERFINEFEITWDDLTKIFKGLVLKILNIDCTYVSFINTENYREWNYIENKLLNIKESLLDKIKGPNQEEIFNNIKKLSPENQLAKYAEMGMYDGVYYVLNNGADPRYNNTLLRKAVMGDNINVIKLLIKHGAKIENHTGCLIEAVKNRNLEILKYLHEVLNMNLNFLLNVRSPYTFEAITQGLMEYAAYWNAPEIIDYLVENGLDVNAPYHTQPEKLPLYLAIEENNTEAVESLLKHSARITGDIKLIARSSNQNIKNLLNKYDKKL